MIFHIPHSSFDIPSDLRPTLLLNDQALGDELRKSEGGMEVDGISTNHIDLANLNWLHGI